MVFFDYIKTMSDLTFVTKTKNGLDVYVDLETSHAATHLKAHPELFNLMKEVLENYEVKQGQIRFQTDLGRIVGQKDLVPTTEADDIFYAKRPNRDKYTRFVRNRKAEPTPFITIELHKKNEKDYEIFTVFIGELCPGFPFGKNDPNPTKREFWNRHALVDGNQEILPETITAECPW